ncbi:AI-2E family transporter [uncultured Anaerococcus sp.]|uniref:AI-2E family transporter n=1 Tax=uncultured Anaerococcus sp. TaxID=293428 RepID=UPI00260CDA1A|nr:AI-2E family transporter [uncultured Anaerococcus sp.]
MKDKEKFLDEKSKNMLKVTLISILVFFAFWYKDRLGEGLVNAYAVLRPILYGLVIAFIINLPMNFFEEKVFARFIDKDKHKNLVQILALILSWIIFFGLVTIIITVFVPELVNAISSLVENIPVFMDKLIEYLNSQRLFKELRTEIINKLNTLDMENITRELTRMLDGKNWGLLTKTSSLLNSFSSWLISMIMGFFFSIYVSMNKKDLQAGSNKLLLANFEEKTVNQVNYVAKLTYDSFSRFFETKLLSCLSLGLICLIGMKILGLPMAGMISILVGAFDIIPYFGPIIATGVGMILIFIQSPTQAMVFLVFVLSIQQLQEKIIYPLVIGKHQGLPAIWIFISAFIGAGLFGIVGMITSMPIATVIYNLIQDSTKRKLRQKNIDLNKIQELNEKSYETMREDKMNFKF